MLHIAEGFSGNIDPGLLVEHCSPSVTALITQQLTGAIVSIPVTLGAMISPRVLFIDNGGIAVPHTALDHNNTFDYAPTGHTKR